MAYDKSKAGIGLGSKISIGSGTSPIGYTLIGEITSIAQAGRQAGTEDVTNMQSGAREFVTTLIDSGTYDLKGNRVADDAGQIALEAAFAGLTIEPFEIELRKTASQHATGDLYTFYALVQEVNFGTVAVDKKIEFNVKLKVSGLITYAAGS